MRYCLYEIKNLINGKIYVGVHKTVDIDDGYMGSGKVIKSAIGKYGIENFTKTILEEFENAEQMFAREAEVVNEAFLAREDVYNLRRGGTGGFDYINANRLNYNNALQQYNLSIDSQHSRKVGQLRGILKPGFRSAGAFDTEKGQHNMLLGHVAVQSESAKAKRKLTLASIHHQQGTTNSQFGKVWITDGTLNRKIYNTDEVPPGWRRGRVFPK